ncbi:hypothetical protein HK104_008346 [Borealophlyctis nickersoniae]|nr:hypothetical protein HK104_008346 [Borealophlyctis nickersoniae]
MEQDLSTVLNDTGAQEQDSSMTDAHYEGTDSRDRERDIRERDVRNNGYGKGGSASPSKEIKNEPSQVPPGTPPDHYRSRGAKSPSPKFSSRTRTPYERPQGDGYGSHRGPAGDYPRYDDPYATKYSQGRRDPSRPSRRECRVYVGNLAYEVGWQDLKDFMRKVGEVVFADILTMPGGRSKGCGVVEFGTPEEAQRAIRELSDTPLMGRPVFIREDREQEAKFGQGPGRLTSRPTDSVGRTIYVGNLPYIVAWQDLKDLFRQAGNVIRADVLEGPDKRSKGSGTVVFESPHEVQSAIRRGTVDNVYFGFLLGLAMFDGYEWHGRRLEVREDRFGGGGGYPSMGRGPPYPDHRGYGKPPPPRGYDSRDYYGYEGYGHGYGAYDGYGYAGYGGYYDRGYGGSEYGPPAGVPPHRGDYYKDYPPPPPPPGAGYAPDSRGAYGADRGAGYESSRAGGSAPGSSAYGDRAAYDSRAPYGDYHR